MSKQTIKHAKGFVNNRFFLAITEVVSNKKTYLAVEKLGSGAWARYELSKERFEKLCGMIDTISSKNSYTNSLKNSIERELVASYK